MYLVCNSHKFWGLGTDLQSGRTQLFDVCESFAPNGFITSPRAKSTNYGRSNGNDVPETGRKRARRKESGSQTEDNEGNETCGGCRNMADTIIEMNRKLDLVLARMEEIDAIKEKQKQLEKVNADLEKKPRVRSRVYQNSGCTSRYLGKDDL